MKKILIYGDSNTWGDNFFLDEHDKWQKYERQLIDQGYSYDEVEKLREYYREKVAEIKQKESAISKDFLN